MSRIDEAKALVAAVLPSCDYATIRSFCGRYGEHGYHDYIVRAGRFRATIIPKDCDFVIKVGACHGGTEQCYREEAIFHAAARQGVSQYFATIYGHFSYEGNEFVVMQKLSENYSDISFYERCIKKDNRLQDFLDEFDINDIHEGNYGYDNRGCPKVFDYGSYRLEDDDDEVNENWPEE